MAELSLFGSVDEARRAAGQERVANLQAIGGQSPFAMAGALFGSMFGGGVNQDPRVVRAQKLQEARASVEAKGLDLINTPGEFMSALAQELSTRGLSEEAWQVMEHTQKQNKLRADAESAAARTKLTETRGRIAEASEGRAVELHGGRLAKGRADAQTAQVKSQYAEANAQLSIASKQAAIQSSLASANASRLSASTSAERAARAAEMHELNVQGKRLAIDSAKQKLATGGLAPGDINKATVGLAKEVGRSNILQVDDTLTRVENFVGALDEQAGGPGRAGLPGVGYAQNLEWWPDMLRKPNGRKLSQMIQKLQNSVILDTSGKAVTKTELARVLKDLGSQVTQGPDAVRRALRTLRNLLNAETAGLFAGYDPAIVELYKARKSNIISTLPEGVPEQATGSSSGTTATGLNWTKRQQ
ncbi:MAG: hypothetical protein ACRD98_00260 [Nitrososphaera sp.]